MNLDPTKIVDHVTDAHAFEFPFNLEWELRQLGHFQITKFMVLEVVAAVLLVLIFVPLARKLSQGEPPKGRFWNMFDAMVVFLRNEVVRPAIGHHDADRFMPLIFTLFFFILFCNLLGLVPFLGSPTAALSTTAPLAVITFLAAIGAGMKRFGPIGFWLGQCPPLDVAFPIKVVLMPMILVLEIVGLFIRFGVLAVRLLANMFGGHFVLAMIIGFIPATAGSLLWFGVAPCSVFGGVAISMLELFVAFLQAYVFAFLGALFIGMCVHQH